jgi:predicted DNA-binding transcriptional regulator AlpA
MREIMQRTGFVDAKIYDLIRTGDFPKWADLPKRASAWHRHEVEASLSALAEPPIRRRRGRPRYESTIASR